MFLAALFWNLGWGNSSPLPGSVALCPWLGECGLPSKCLVEHKAQNKKWVFHMLCLYTYHNELHFFPSYALRSGTNHPASFFSSNLHGGPTEISPSLMREWRKCGGFIFISIFTFFLVWVTWRSFYIKNTFKCILLTWMKFISSSAEMLYKCGALSCFWAVIRVFRKGNKM